MKGGWEGGELEHLLMMIMIQTINHKFVISVVKCVIFAVNFNSLISAVKFNVVISVVKFIAVISAVKLIL